MTIEENKALIRRYLEALSGKEKPPALVNQYVAESDEDLRQHIAVAEAGFPRYELPPDDMIAEGDKVVVRATMRATHLGEFFGVPATGKAVTMPLIIIYRIADGQIVEHWIQMDVFGLMQQLGAIPTPA